MLLSKWKYKMYLGVVMTMFLLCPLITAQVKTHDETYTDTRDVSSGGKSSLKSQFYNKSTRNEHSDDTSKNKTPTPVERKQLSTPVVKNNVTVGETQRVNNVDSVNFGAVLRGFYVFLGLSVIVVMYFTVRAIRLGRKKTKVMKYGILASREDVEMTPLGAEEEEDDNTIFDLSSHPVR